MPHIPEDRQYTRDHLWVLGELKGGDRPTAGLTDHAQMQLGEVVFVDLPKAGTKVSAGDPVGSVESVKAASEICSPVSGEIMAVNDELLDNPELVNEDPYGDGWMFQVRVAGDSVELLSAAEYIGFTTAVSDDS